MTSHPLTLHEHTLLQRNADSPSRSAIETPAGSLILQSFCPPSLVASLKADRGLHAFTHIQESINSCWGLQSAPIVRSPLPTPLPARLLVKSP
jgi:hypothetical protein